MLLLRRALVWARSQPPAALLTVFALAVAVTYLVTAGGYSLVDYWETLYAEVARQITSRRDVISLWHAGSPQDPTQFWSKPPLTFWLMALGMTVAQLNGVHAAPGEYALSAKVEWACRLPIVLIALGCAYCVFWAVSQLTNRRAGVIASFVLLTSVDWALLSHQCMTDMPFVGAMTAALCFAAVALIRRDDSAPSLRLRLVTAGLPTSAALLQAATFTWKLDRPGHAFAFAPYVVIALTAGLITLRSRTRSAVLLDGAWSLCAVATMAKGPAGLALPAIIAATFLVLERRPMAIIRELRIIPGLLYFVTLAFPWVHAELIRHGREFWHQFFDENHLQRARGRFGDRGFFDYYIESIAYGLFPWTGIGAVAVMRPLGVAKARTPAEKLHVFAILWLLIDLLVITAVRTKFHHYALPIIPPLAILCGVFIDEHLDAGVGLERVPMVVGVLVTAATTISLCSDPYQLAWRFTLDYVLPVDDQRILSHSLILALRVGIAAAGLLTTIAIVRSTRREPTTGILWLGVVGLSSTIALLGGALPSISTHFGQKSLIATYYQQRTGVAEPLVTWNLSFFGETFYTRNQIFGDAPNHEPTLFVGDEMNPRFHDFLVHRAGRRMFFLVKRRDFERLREQLPLADRASLRLIDGRNVNIVLASANISAAR